MEEYFANCRDRNVLLDVAAMARQAQAAAAVASTGLLQGDSAFVVGSPSPLEALVSTVVGPFC